MTSMTINAKNLNRKLQFSMTQNGYLWVSINGREPRQACERGQINGGVTVMTTAEGFERDVRRWYRAYVRRCAEMA